MKKWIIKVFLWDHFCQVLWVVCSIPAIILWIHGKATSFHAFCIGFNIGSAFVWQMMLWWKKQTEFWRDEMFKQLKKRE